MLDPDTAQGVVHVQLQCDEMFTVGQVNKAFNILSKNSKFLCLKPPKLENLR